jgi:guanidinobutyrase
MQLSIDSLIVAFTELKVTDLGDMFEVKNALLGSSVQVSRSVMDLIAFFRTPHRVEEFLRHTQVDRNELDPVFRKLLEAHVLVRADELSALEGGLLQRVPEPIGHSCTIDDLVNLASPPAAAIIGAPVDIATGARGGSRHGPAEIRRNMQRLFDSHDGSVSEKAPPRKVRLIDFDFRRAYVSALPDVLDLGDVAFTPGESNDVVGLRIRRAVELVLNCNTIPVILGGDHSITWFVLQAIYARFGPVGLIHFDAHADLYPPTRRILHHGNPFVFALEAGYVKTLFQVGLRGLAPVPADASPVSDPRIAYVSALEVQKSGPEELLRELPRNIPYYLTFDVDCLAPHVAPETGAPLSGGLGFYQALEWIDYAARSFDFVGADFVEVTGPEHWQNLAAIATARYVTQFLLRTCEFEPLQGYFAATKDGR